MPPFVIREVRPEDIEAITAIYRPYVEEETASFETTAPTAAEMEARRQRLFGVFPWLVCQTAEGVVAGYAYGSRLGERPGYDWAAIASIYISAAHCHGGMGKALYTALECLLAAQGYRSLYGLVSSPNPASERFHLAMGFELQADLVDVGYKFGQPLSVRYYAKRLLPVMEDPPRPVRFDALPRQTVNEILGRG